jgi:hypothetical protein
MFCMHVFVSFRKKHMYRKKKHVHVDVAMYTCQSQGGYVSSTYPKRHFLIIHLRFHDFACTSADKHVHVNQ